MLLGSKLTCRFHLQVSEDWEQAQVIKLPLASSTCKCQKIGNSTSSATAVHHDQHRQCREARYAGTKYGTYKYVDGKNGIHAGAVRREGAPSAGPHALGVAAAASATSRTVRSLRVQYCYYRVNYTL